MNKPLTINDYAAPIEAKYGTGTHIGIHGAIVTACSDTPTVELNAATGNLILSLPVSGDALTIARAQVLANRRAKRVELSDRYPTLNL